MMDNLDIVTSFYEMHKDEMLPQTLTSAWRSSLRQQGVQEGQTTSKFSLLEFLQNQNGLEDTKTVEEFSNVSTEFPSDAAGPTDVNPAVALDLVTPSSNRPGLLDDEFWSSSALEMNFDLDGSQVDPFSRIFEDWSLVSVSQE
jgi:hypothetical protein